MNSLTETLARATLRGSDGGAFPKSAKAVDFPLVAGFYLEKAPSDDEIKTFVDALEAFPELRSAATPRDSKSVKNLRHLRWECVEDVGNVKAMRRFKRVEVETAKELSKVFDDAVLEQFDTSAPLWDCVIVTRKKGVSSVWDDDQTGYPEPPVVLVRVSHAIGDGIALVDVLKRVSSALDGGDVKLLSFKRRAQATKRSVLAAIWAFITFIFVCMYGAMKALLTAAGPYDTKTTFKGSRPPYGFSGKRRVVVCPPVAIDDIKAIKNVSGCTVNDIVVAALAGAIQAYHAKVGDKSATKNPFLRSATPYAFPERVTGALTNSWTFVSLTFPMGVMSAATRLQKAKKTCDFMKRSPEPYVTRWLNKFVNAAGPDVQRKVVFDYMSRHSMVFTNVPGPTETIVLMGSRVRDIVFACANLVNQVSVVSYSGSLRLTLVVDPDATPDAQYIGDMFKNEIECLRKEVL